MLAPKRDLDVRVIYARFDKGTGVFNTLKPFMENKVFAGIYINTNPQLVEFTPDATVLTAGDHQYKDATWGDYNDLHFTLSLENADNKQVVIELYRLRDGGNVSDSAIIDRVSIRMQAFLHDDKNPRPPRRVTYSLDDGTELTLIYRLGPYIGTIKQLFNFLPKYIGLIGALFGIGGTADGIYEHHFDHNNFDNNFG